MSSGSELGSGLKLVCVILCESQCFTSIFVTWTHTFSLTLCTVYAYEYWLPGDKASLIRPTYAGGGEVLDLKKLLTLCELSLGGWELLSIRLVFSCNSEFDGFDTLSMLMVLMGCDFLLIKLTFCCNSPFDSCDAMLGIDVCTTLLSDAWKTVPANVISGWDRSFLRIVDFKWWFTRTYNRCGTETNF